MPGKENIVADALSWPPRADQGKDDNQDITILLPIKFIDTAIIEDDIPEEDKQHFMVLTYNHTFAGHPGRDETICQTRKYVQWYGMNQWITDYVKGCTTCQENKILTHKKKTPLYRITTPEGALPF